MIAAFNAPLPVQPQIQLKDASGNDVAQSGVVVTAAIQTSPAGGAVGGITTATSNASGRAVFTGLSISGPSGAYTLRFSAPGLGQVVSNTVTLGAGGASRLAMVTQPSATAFSGTPIAQQPSVRLQDASGNPVALAGVQVTVTLSGTGNVGGTNIRSTDANGVAAFTDLSIDALIGTYQLIFSGTGLQSATSSDILLAPGSPARLSITTQPSVGAQSGVVLTSQPVIQLRDTPGNAVPQAGRTITAAIASGPAGGTLGGTTSVITSGSGVGTFTNLAITGPSGAYTIQFTSTGLVSVTSGSITLGAGAPTTIAANSATTQGGTAGSAAGAPPSVIVKDASNNPVQNVAVTFTVTGGGGSIVPVSPATVNTNASGVATLTTWTLGTTVGVNTVTAAVTGLSGSPVTFTATSTAGAANTIAANSSVSQTATVNTTVAAAPSVRVTDANNNPVSGVSVTFAVTQGGGTINPTTSISTNASGIATLTSWTLGTTAGNNRVTATASVPNGSPVTFNATGTAGAANTIAANSSTSQTAAVGSAVPIPPSVKVTDAFGNVTSSPTPEAMKPKCAAGTFWRHTGSKSKTFIASFGSSIR